MKEALEFEMKLDNFSLPARDSNDILSSYNPLTLREMQQRYPYVQWVEYINFLLPSSQKVDENEVVVLERPSYFDKLGKILNETSPRTTANFLMWRIVSYSSNFLTEDLFKRKLEFEMRISAHSKPKPRWKKCVGVTERLKIALSSMYVRKYFRVDSKATALDMVNQIRAEFETMMKDVKWMDEDTRQAALKKLHAISTYIGYADELMNDSKIEQFYKELKIDESSYLSFVSSIDSFRNDNSFKRLNNPGIKTDWKRPTYHVNAFYSPPENEIIFPAAILQGYFFSAQRPQYMNYAAIGSVIGHEITHGFDNVGKQYDSNGNLVDWWDPKTSLEFSERAKCLVEQYGNYTEPITGLKVNGNKTLGENIADNGGLKLAYSAYQKWEHENEPEEKLPGMNFTQHQLFWISAAQTWCSVRRPEFLKKLILTDTHPPSRFRANGVMSNLKEFANDFQCPEGSPMDPVEKCRVW